MAPGVAALLVRLGPRPDGLLTFHVKAVQAGWVSNALVHRAAPGDVLRLGPAAGAMTVDHASGADLLCLGGGTGIAPIRALVEEVAEYGAAGRSVEVFYGARQAAELYDLAELGALAERHPWLSVHPVLSGPGPPAVLCSPVNCRRWSAGSGRGRAVTRTSAGRPR